MPLYIVWALGIFQSSGRFFWLIGYAQMAIVIVLGFRRAQPLMALCLAAAAILQLFDVQPLREQIIASIAAGPGSGGTRPWRGRTSDRSGAPGRGRSQLPMQR